MPLMLFWVLALWSLSMLTEPVLQDEAARPSAVASASVEVDRWKTFLYIANLFMQSAPGAGTFHWGEMSAMASLPQALLARPYPPSWSVVVDASGRWSACTPLSEKAIGIMAQWASPAGLAMTVVNPSKDQGFMVLGPDPSLYQVCP
jgi:hypothetical protein